MVGLSGTFMGMPIITYDLFGDASQQHVNTGGTNPNSYSIRVPINREIGLSSTPSILLITNPLQPLRPPLSVTIPHQARYALLLPLDKLALNSRPLNSPL